MSKYAQGTSVDVERSLGEIRRIVQRFGASSFGYLQDEAATRIAFNVRGLSIEMRVPQPERKEFSLTAQGRRRTESAAFNEWEQECKRRMRSLAAVIKAKLVAIDDQVATIEQEFLPYIVLPNGRTVGEELIPQLPALSSGALALPGRTEQTT